MAEITSITLPFILNVSVNCYLVRGTGGFILIDTGPSGKRGDIERRMEEAGCRTGDLRLIILTHGDFDHSGNAAHLRRKHGAKVAMHRDDAGMVEKGDMMWNRSKRNPLSRAAFRLMFRLGEPDRLEPDLFLDERSDLSGYLPGARVLGLPGHSLGSIAILTAEGELFCGDLLGNVGKPDIWSIIDDRAAAEASIERLRPMGIGTVYPGHGKPFPMGSLRSGR
jgi:glyoxylase-like metal-dependent hydrolase (beta-lactamase superfamily II)